MTTPRRDVQEQICRMAEAYIGVRIGPLDRSDVQARLDSARVAAQCEEWTGFADRLSAEDVSGDAWAALIRSVTIGETYLFRYKAQMDLLRERVLPGLIEQRRREAHPWLRIWSAGCATGEEAYSLAILVRELIPDPQGWAILILGTDLNKDSLQRARKATYGPWSARETDPALMSRYTEPSAGGFVITDDVRRMVTFSALNLVQDGASDGAVSGMDVILCRNVTMYFGGESARAVASRLLSALNPGGWLLVGPTEADAQVFAGFDLVSAPGTTAYRRPEGGASAVRVEPAAPVSASEPLVEPAKPRPAVSTAPRLRSGASTSEACLAAARAAGNAGCYDDGRDWCRRALEIEPTDADALHLLGMIHAGQQQTALAVEAFRKAIYLQPDFILAHYGLSHELRLLGDEAAANRALDTLGRMLRPVPDLHPLRGGDGMTAGELRQVLESELVSVLR